MTAWGYGMYPRSLTVAERRAKAQKQAAKLGKKGIALDPVLLDGRRIASSWWGLHWNENLERYADFAYRLERGRSYVRNGMVLDLKIEAGQIRAKVAGSRSTPYDVTVKIKPLPPATWKALVAKASGKIESVSTLLEGGFPEELRELFFSQAGGLFPTPKQIEFECTCPDWASMCKHVAATLYGVGARLDRQPALFFDLRAVKLDALVGKAAGAAVKTLLTKAAAKPAGKSRRIFGDAAAPADIGAVFGIDMETTTFKSEEQRIPTPATTARPAPAIASEPKAKKPQQRGRAGHPAAHRQRKKHAGECA